MKKLVFTIIALMAVTLNATAYNRVRLVINDGTTNSQLKAKINKAKTTSFLTLISL